jgi:hypothetical protein
MKLGKGRFEAEWVPSGPTNIRSPRHRRKFIEAYQAARTEYMTLVAAALGGRIGVFDVGSSGLKVHVTDPAAQH